MQAIITAAATYALKASIALALLYTPYILFMRKETLFGTNRTTLLLALLLSFAIPFIDIPALHIDIPAAEEIEYFAENISIGEAQPVVQPTTATVETKQINVQDAIYYFLCLPYIIVTLIVVAKKIYELYRINKNIRRGTLWRDDRDDYTIYCHAGETAPYSWMKNIVISQEDYEKFGKEIILHEEGHIRHRHSWDMLLISAAESLQWFNPFVHMLATDLKDIHEFQADAYVLQRENNSKKYQMLIIRKAVGHASYTLANSFNHSKNLKKRITMMLKKKSNPVRCATALYILPAAALTLSLFASPEETVGNNQPTEKTSLYKSSETFAQNDTTSEIIFKVCEKMPEFPGGEKALENYLSITMDSPTGAVKLQNAVVQFVINSDGSVSNVKIVKSTGNAEIDKGVIKHVSTMPKWTPGTQGGKKVRVELTRPYNLKNLTNDKKEQAEVVKTAAVSLTTNSEIYEICEKSPEFPDGMTALMKYLATNTHYPDDAREKNIQGRAIIGFIVKSDGSISEIKVVKSSGNESLDKEAMRVVSTMPKWKPGTQDGKNVNVRFCLPIMFRLQ
ncbi:MAG: TonB family protein [Bacteroidaceae bacterium]|nr:TonB family protein [Bacteroidaceae bacterium]